MKNPHAQALGRLNKGGKKTMSSAAIRQRALASKKAAERRKKLRPKKTLTENDSGITSES